MTPDQKAAMDEARMAYEASDEFKGRGNSFERGWMARDAWEARYPAQPSDVHLVRPGQTLCGLAEWEAGNVNIKFAIEQGITTCVRCLRQACLELLSASAQPKAKTPEERVVVREFPKAGGWGVYEDGVNRVTFHDKRMAEALREGLIRELRRTADGSHD